MNKILYFFLILLFVYSCSFNKNSKFWTKTETIVNEKIEPTISQEEKVEDEGKEKNLKISSNSESLEANEKNKKPIQA